jgi:hypothetical protein
MRTAGIDRELFFSKVYFPVLKALGTTRQEVRRAMKKREDGEKIHHGGTESLRSEERGN